MSKYKYPLIPKEYYPAVMLACKIIRERNTFNKAVKIASKYYNVDENELIYHIRARQAAGQKGTSAGRKYKWYIIFEITECCEGSMSKVTGLSYEKATSVENAVKHFRKNDHIDSSDSYYTYSTFHVPLTEQGFDTEEEAEDFLRSDEGERLFHEMKQKREY